MSSFPYNCVGLIFASRRAWIEIDYIYDILREDGYRRIAASEVMIGDVVVYKDDKGDLSHVALVVTVDRSIGESIRVVSKWGERPGIYPFYGKCAGSIRVSLRILDGETMTPEEIFDYIESLRFDVEMNLASGFNLFRRWLSDDVNLNALMSQLQASETLKQETFSRFLALLALLPEDTEFNAARYDAALSAYLHTLHAVDADLAQQAIARILPTPHLFWAKRLAQHLQAAQTERL